MAHTEKCRGCLNENKCDYINCQIEHDAQIRAKAIEEFAERLLELAPKNYAGTLELGGRSCYLSANQIEKIAEEMKGGAE